MNHMLYRRNKEYRAKGVKASGAFVRATSEINGFNTDFL